VASAAELYRQGLTLYGKRDYVAAVAVYRQALAERPEWSDCMQAMGMALMHDGKLAEAFATLERVTELAPEDPLAFTSLSMCLQRMDKIPEAETAQSKARLLSWKQELKTNPHAPPPAGAIQVQS